MIDENWIADGDPGPMTATNFVDPSWLAAIAGAAKLCPITRPGDHAPGGLSVNVVISARKILLSPSTPCHANTRLLKFKILISRLPSGHANRTCIVHRR